jgi:hypothetical protein
MPEISLAVAEELPASFCCVPLLLTGIDAFALSHPDPWVAH